jgi:hypothetical protein
METEKSVVEILVEIERLERDVASLYGIYAEKFVDDAEVSALFSALHEEEIYHATLAALSRTFVETALLTKSKTFEDTKIQSVDLFYLAGFLSFCIKDAQITPLHDALIIAHKIETSLVESYLKLEIGEKYPAIRDIIESLSQSPQGDTHEDRIKYVLSHRFSD